MSHIRSMNEELFLVVEMVDVGCSGQVELVGFVVVAFVVVALRDASSD